MHDDPIDNGTVTENFDMTTAVDTISQDLFPAKSEPELGKKPDVELTPELSAESASPPAPSPADMPPRPAPKSWPKEMHDHWDKTSKEVQDYWETREKQMLDGLDQYKADAQYGKPLREVIKPFESILQQAGLDAPKAVSSLLMAHARLTQGTQEARRAAYEELGRSLGIVAPSTTPAVSVDPAVQELRSQIQQVQQHLTAKEQATLEEVRAKTVKEVEAFASDTKAHPYFEEVADDLVLLLKTGASLQDAYEKAVWANPVTRAKEIARVQTEHEAKLKENARLAALPKKKAAGANVNSRETQRTPTEPLGSMDDTMRSTLADIKARVH